MILTFTNGKPAMLKKRFGLLPQISGFRDRYGRQAFSFLCLSKRAAYSPFLSIPPPWSFCLSGKSCPCNSQQLMTRFQRNLNRGSYMSAYFLLNLLNKLGKRDKM